LGAQARTRPYVSADLTIRKVPPSNST